MATKHKIRDKRGRIVEVESSPRKAIRRMCVECMCFVDREVANCLNILCPLYPFRGVPTEQNLIGAAKAESVQNQEIVS